MLSKQAEEIAYGKALEAYTDVAAKIILKKKQEISRYREETTSHMERIKKDLKEIKDNIDGRKPLDNFDYRSGDSNVVYYPEELDLG